MTERLQASRPERQPILENERKLATFLMTIFDEAEMLQTTVYDTKDEASEVIRTFTGNSVDRLNQIPSVAGIGIRMSGEGVSVPNASIVDLEDDTPGMAVVIDKENKFSSLPPFETLDGYIESVHGTVGDSEIEGKYDVKLFILAKLAASETATIQLANTNAPMVEVSIRRRAIATISPDTVIEVEALQQYESRREMVDELAKLGMLNSLFRRQLNKLERALFSEDPKRYTLLSKVELIHAVGELGAMHARKGQLHSDAVSRAILESVGKNRPMQVAYFQPLAGEKDRKAIISGTLVDVLMPASEEDELQPTLILEGKNTETSEVHTYYAEMNQIQALSF